MKKLLSIILLSLLALSSSSCTDAQWRRFQEINSKVASYVNDAILAVGLVKGFVEAAIPPEARGTVSDVWDAIQACNEMLQVEAAIVEQSHTPLDTPAQVGAAFPRFIAAWDHLSDSIRGHNIGASSGAPMAARSRIHTPRIVRFASGGSQ